MKDEFDGLQPHIQLGSLSDRAGIAFERAVEASFTRDETLAFMFRYVLGVPETELSAILPLIGMDENVIEPALLNGRAKFLSILEDITVERTIEGWKKVMEMTPAVEEKICKRTRGMAGKTLPRLSNELIAGLFSGKANDFMPVIALALTTQGVSTEVQDKMMAALPVNVRDKLLPYLREIGLGRGQVHPLFRNKTGGLTLP